MWWIILLFGIVLSCTIFIGGYYVGKWYAAEYKRFQVKLRHLVFIAPYACKEPLFKKAIEEAFVEIKKFDCGDANDIKQIKELEDLFNERFKEVSINQN